VRTPTARLHNGRAFHDDIAMSRKLNRRQFVHATTFAGVVTVAGSRPLMAQAPAFVGLPTSKPVVIASANGNKYKNGGTQTCVEKAFSMMTSGADVLDALIAGVTIVELDPEDTSVGYGGLPNADGVVQLDACCMHGPRRRAGGVAALEGVRSPAGVAQKVMNETDHHLLVGKGAQDFARAMGFTIEADLNTEKSRKTWLEWKRRTDPLHYLSPTERDHAWRNVAREMIADGWFESDHYHGTINCNGVGPKGEICGVTTTSGLAWKIPGRTGDSPILGAGLYVDGEVGAAGSTGRGEANLYNLCSFAIVEEMRRGATPKDAALTALKRVAKNTIEKRLWNSRRQPNFNLTFYVVNAKGNYAGVSMYEGEYAVCTENGAQTLKTEALFAGTPND
jgi:N4-(beta-N-acetylglucosaminyl)-L-asparaginase